MSRTWRTRGGEDGGGRRGGGQSPGVFLGGGSSMGHLTLIIWVKMCGSVISVACGRDINSTKLRLKNEQLV